MQEINFIFGNCFKKLYTLYSNIKIIQICKHKASAAKISYIIHVFMLKNQTQKKRLQRTDSICFIF
jgi:hypothetical protein